MRLESKKYLYDIAGAAGSAIEFVDGKSFSEYTSDLVLRSAVGSWKSSERRLPS